MAINDLKGAAAQQYLGYQFKPFGSNVGGQKPASEAATTSLGGGFAAAINSRYNDGSGQLTLPKVSGEYSTNGNIYDANLDNISEAYMGSTKPPVEPQTPNYMELGAAALQRNFDNDPIAAMEYLNQIAA